MDIFVIHSGKDKIADAKVEEINKFNGDDKKHKKANVLMLRCEKAFWKSEAKKLIKSAQMVLYIVSEVGHKSKNIDWEIRQAKKYQKAIVVFNECGYKVNASLKTKDPFTKKEEDIYDTITCVEELYQIIEDYENGKHIKLFNEDEMNIANLFEQYKLFSNTSESLVSRRQNVNNFYITANTALVTILATISSLNDNLFSQVLVAIALTIPGILLNRSWLKVMESYALVNSSKMKVLSMLEQKLSASVFDAEWQAMANKYNKKRYVSFSDRERVLPIIFNWVFVIIDVVCLCILLFKFVL